MTFLIRLLALVLALSAGIGLALLVFGGLDTHISNGLADPLSWRGDDLRIVGGAPVDGQATASKQSGAVRISIAQNQNRLFVIATPETPLNAASFASASVFVETGAAEMKLALFWRRVGLSYAFTRSFEPDMAGEARIALQDEKNWRGKISDFGIVAVGAEGQSITLQRIALQSLSFPAIVRESLQPLQASFSFNERWSMRSINFLAASGKPGLAAPLLLVAVAFGGGLLVLIIFFVSRRRTDRRGLAGTVCVLFVVAWLILDAKWQWVLMDNLGDARATFAGKSWQEKQRAAFDHILYEHAMQLKSKVLAGRIQRIFILHRNNNSAARLRLQYHLLPHNIYNFDSQPKIKALRKGDYIVTVGKLPDLRYDAQQALIELENKQTITAPIVYSSDVVKAYRISKAGS